MSFWKELCLKDIKELKGINYTKLNVIQQGIADMFQVRKLTIMEVFCILNGMLEKEMVNYEQAKKYYKKNRKAILESENIELDCMETYGNRKDCWNKTNY